MKKSTIIGIAAASVLVLVGVLVFGAVFVTVPVLSQGPGGGWSGPGRMMSGWGWNGRGMMMQGGSWNRYAPQDNDSAPYDSQGGWDYAGACPMFGNWQENQAGDTQALTMEQATQAVEDYLAATQNEDLQLAEVMEFTGNFYAEIREKSMGVGAFELLVDRYTGAVSPEPGPNMMWNTEYGHMGARWGMPGMSQIDPGNDMTISAEEAVDLAQAYLDNTGSGLTAGEAEPFHGYYTLHTEKDGNIVGMLSVNGYTGQVWYHNWHGDFIAMTEEHHDG